MSVNLSPIGNGVTFLDDTGQPLSGGLLYTYQAGSSTFLATYTDNNGLIQNSNPIVLGSDGKLPSELWLTYGYNYKFVLKDSTGAIINTYDNLYGILGTVPVAPTAFTSGMIMLWAGSSGSIPSGWQLCNGTNGAPDLRDRFVVGAGSSYSVGQTGGSADAIVVSHTHSITDPGHTHTYTRTYTGNDSTMWHTNTTSNIASGNITDNPGVVTGAIISATTGITNNTTGTSGTGANIPPYYALCYIYKL